MCLAFKGPLRPFLKEERNLLETIAERLGKITEREKAEEELLFKAALLEAESETTIDGILVVDSEGKSISFNKNFGRMWNIPQQILDTRDDEKMLQYVLSQLKDPEQFLGRVKYLYAHKNEKSRDELEFKDGRVFDRYSSPLIGSNNQDYGRIWYFRDITERKKAEEALVQSEEQYRSVVENIGIGVSLISPKMEILTMNKQLREWFPDIDVSKKPICYKTFNKPAREDVCSYCPTYKSLQDGQVHESVTETPVGGKIINYRIISSPVKDKDGKVIAAIEMVEDITERKKTEEALKESEERYRALFQGAAEGILVADTETKKLIYANPAICKMLGYAEEELKQMGVRDIHPEEDLEYVISEFEAQARGEKTSSSIPCLRKDGAIMYADINTAMVLIGGRQCNVGFFTDITERKRIKAELENYKEKVLQAQKHTYISSMGAIVAHQISQPLTMINMLLAKALELEQAEDNCCPPVFQKIEESLTEAKKAALIIRKFRQYSKDITLRTTGKVNVSSTANRIISMLSERAKQAKINISAKTLGDLPEVGINEKALEQIFLIIIQNAVEAADGRKQHRLTISGQTTDKEIKLQFSDDCCGIAPENLDKIFEPFFSIKSNGKGLGLGLEIVQQILIGHGGQIGVESQIDKGTTFYVTLPVKN